ncbi:hypothetical protein [Magnetospirillum sp. SS-4]|uniref:hypothetical protein n=1 Tax=Magnetospirillum sp. SS-4 TaxID=2681465 RepID=UPI00137F0F16|nr:hypothetical protein [Magnetospirillum sp. SS-4]CAA7624777.1 conserved exported hypothetical protein [Magnetospirillum sp. SS-4]
MGQFQIGLTMAGAISAGAYTAGVFDFLIQALSAWDEESRKNGFHRTAITTMTGASAGGMTAVLGAIAMGRGLQPTQKGNGDRRVNCVLPGLYAAWVEEARMVSRNSAADLLSFEDLGDGKVHSLLNASLLDRIQATALKAPDPIPAVTPYGFLADPLHVYVTLTNLRGIQYDIDFGTGKYRMLNHADRKHFSVKGLGGNSTAASIWSNGDPAAAHLTLAELNQPGEVGPGWKAMGVAAVATGAFPVGLAARRIETGVAEYKSRPWPVVGALNDDGSHHAVIDPHWPDAFQAMDRRFSYVAVDGGTINNEPFELARFSIMDGKTTRNPRSSWDADRAVIMVAPFPEGYSFPVSDPADADYQLVKVIAALLPTMIQQARFKDDELVAAAKPDVRSRFLIAPKRGNGASVSSKDIACGLLGGFGGFLDQGFREHDFKLGQRNCQQFLRNHFNLHVNNKVFGGNGEAPAAGADETDKNNELPIVPLIGDLKSEISEPDWPRMSMEAFETLMRRIEDRADRLVPLLSKQEIANSRMMRLGVAMLWPVSGRRMLMSLVRRSILADLIRRDQIEDGLAAIESPRGTPLPGFSAQQREVLAALAGSSADLRTIPSLARQTSLGCAQVTEALDLASGVSPGAVHAVWKSAITDDGGQIGYALHSRKPNLVETLPVLGGMVRKISGVKID